MAVSDNSLRTGRGRFLGEGIDNDPMSSMGNLMDVMLVFACALMIALVTHYNVQLSETDATQEEEQQADVQEIDADLASAADVTAEDVSAFQEVGTLYKDPETGEFYVVN